MVLCYKNCIKNIHIRIGENKMNEIIKNKVRRAKLNYLRDRVGKAAKVKELVK